MRGEQALVIKRLKLVNYRSFQNFTVNFSRESCLVGPNNAGKSTVLTALRLSDSMLRLAHSRAPQARVRFKDRTYQGYPLSLTEFQSLQESLRYEFRNSETWLELTFDSGNRLVAVWPEEDEYDEPNAGAFFLVEKNGVQPRTARENKEGFPRPGVIPIITPLEHTEKVLSESYVRSSQSTRLSSRHFRNQLWLLAQGDEWGAFTEFAAPWITGFRLNQPAMRVSRDGQELDVFIDEVGSRVPKEVIWAGDGMQVWLQILYHAYRLRDSPTIVLDEPDVYLHADLQRRVVRLFDSLDCQTVIATHSPEVISEMPTRGVIWIDKAKRHAKTLVDDSLLEKLSNTLGSQFNLKLASAMKSRVVLLVEGKDMKVLRKLAQTSGAASVAAEDGVTVIQLNGFSNHGHVEPFKWIVDDLLDGSVECHVFLDRDYRSHQESMDLAGNFRQVGVQAHVWERKELESYLLHPEAIARVSGAAVEAVSAKLSEIASEMESDVFSRMLDQHLRSSVSANNHQVTAIVKYKEYFDVRWAEDSWRLSVVPPKQVLSKLNQWLQAERGVTTVSAERLAAALTVVEIPVEMRNALIEVDDAVTRSRALTY